jgi:hypothetical protein
MRILELAPTLFLSGLLVAVGCSRGGSGQARPARPADAVPAAPVSGGDASAPPTAPAARMVVKTATLVLESDDPDGSASRARSVVEAADGFVVQSETRPWNGAGVYAFLRLRRSRRTSGAAA